MTTKSAWRPHTWHSCWVVVCAVFLALPGPLVHSADLSMQSDLGRPDISSQKLLSANGLVGNVVSIDQTGEANVTEVQQFGGTRNNLQLVQIGADLHVQALQQGGDNALNFNQIANSSSADLSQVGNANTIEAQQAGVENMLIGSQTGNSNSVVVTQPTNTQFTFSQTGDQNQIQAELSQGQAIEVNQIGSQMSVSISPQN